MWRSKEGARRAKHPAENPPPPPRTSHSQACSVQFHLLRDPATQRGTRQLLGAPARGCRYKPVSAKFPAGALKSRPFPPSTPHAATLCDIKIMLCPKSCREAMPEWPCIQMEGTAEQESGPLPPGTWCVSMCRGWGAGWERGCPNFDLGSATLLALCPWGNWVTSLCLSCLTCKIVAINGACFIVSWGSEIL